MAAEHWLRWHHGTVTDPKWRVVAARATSALSRNVTVGHVIAVWAAMLECASQANPRGELVGWDDEDVGAGLGLDTDEVAAVRMAMQGKVLDETSLSGWKRRQPKAEDRTAKERKQAQRDREKSQKESPANRDDGKCHGMSRSVTTETETETEEKQKLEPAIAGLSPAAPDDGESAGGDDDSGEQPNGRPPCPQQRIVALYHEILPELRQVRDWNETRRRLLARRWAEHPERQELGWWRGFFEYVRGSDFLMGKATGRDGRPFDCDLEWLVRPTNFAKVIEGKYENDRD